MPHLKVNVNGKRYTISGLTRETCSKQILCALAKVDAELQARKTVKEQRNLKNDLEDSASEDQSLRPRQTRESRRNSKKEERCKTYKEAEGKVKDDRKRNANQKGRSTKKIAQLNSKGIQTSNGMLETLGKVAESQQNCLSTQHKEDDLKVQVLETSLPRTVNELNRKDVEVVEDVEDVEDAAVMAENSERKPVDDHAKDTDHDTGISELHSDSSFETNQGSHNKEETTTLECSALSYLNHETQITVKCASTNTDSMEPVDNTDLRKRNGEVNSFSEDFIVAQLLGSETDVENDEECICSCVYVDLNCEELQDEIDKVRGELKLTEAKLADQNKMIESLDVLIHADQCNEKEQFDDVIFNDDITKRIDELKQSIKLSNQLYDYQKIETRANALELERIESQIRRKRWHVESLLKELRSMRNNSPMGGGQERTVENYRKEGTLV